MLSGDNDLAEQAFKAASQRFPTDSSVLPRFASLAERLGHLEDAREALMRFAVLVDEDAEQAAHAERIGTLSLALNDPLSAVRWYEKSQVLSAPNAEMLARLADAQLRMGQIEEAKATLDRALAKDDTNPTVRAVSRRLAH